MPNRYSESVCEYKRIVSQVPIYVAFSVLTEFQISLNRSLGTVDVELSISSIMSPA